MVGCDTAVTGCRGGQCPSLPLLVAEGRPALHLLQHPSVYPTGSTTQPGKVATWSHQKGVKLSCATEPVWLVFLLGYGISVGMAAFVLWAVWVLFVSVINFHC